MSDDLVKQAHEMAKVQSDLSPYDCYDDSYLLNDLADRIKELEAELALAVEVKPLVWYESPDHSADFCADALGLTYAVDCDIVGLCSWGFFRKVGREAYDESWDIEAAKAAAQADYTARILATLKGQDDE